MKKVPHVKEKLGTLFPFLLVFTLLGCQTTNQNNPSLVEQGYTQLDLTNSKDKEFYEEIKKSLKNQGSLISVSADAQELSLYRDDKRPFPTNYRYTLKANPRVSLEDIKQANLKITNQ